MERRTIKFDRLLFRLIAPVFLGFITVMLFNSVNVYAKVSNQNTQVKTDSTYNSNREYENLRGIERKSKDGSRAFKTTVNAVLFIPRTVTDGLLYSAGYGANLIGDSKFIEKTENILYFYNRQLGWYPIVSISSGSNPAAGAAVFFRNKSRGISIAGAYGGSEFWASQIKTFYIFRTGETVWKISFSGRINKRDDYEFYGFGSDPSSDPRNSFNTDASEEFVLFAQRLLRTPLVIGMRPSSKWEFFYAGFYQERQLSSPDNGNKRNLTNIYNAGNLPGAETGNGSTEKQIYNEISIRFDTRKYRNRISPGIRVEGYAGISVGVDDNESRFSRSGLDAAFYLPIIKNNRLIVPRLVLDMVNNLNNDVPISFADYPRQPTFRGVSSKTLLRTDEISLVPSVEYQWPITFNIGGHLFIDYLIVADSFNKITFSNSPYAYGIGFDLQVSNREVARFSVASGSEGLRLDFSLGFTLHTNDRTKWQ